MFPRKSSHTVYDLESASNTDELGFAIGELLVDVGQKIDDKGLIADAENIFHVTPEMVAAIHALNESILIAEDDDEEDAKSGVGAISKYLAKQAEEVKVG